MKKITYLLILLISVFSCTKESSTTENILPDYDANLIASRYLVLTDNSYKLNLTGEQAENLLISQKQYRRMLQEIKNVNNKIKEIKQKGVMIQLTDPKEHLVNQTNRCLRDSVPTKSGCGRSIITIQTIDSSPVWKHGMLPLVTQVGVSFWCGGLIDTVVYGIEINGQQCFGSGISIVGWTVCRTELYPHYSNGPAKFYFQTMNSNGGMCTFYEQRK